MTLNQHIQEYKDALQHKIEVSRLADDYQLQKRQAHYRFLNAKDALRAAELEAQEVLV